jgi:hypothetical protein
MADVPPIQLSGKGNLESVKMENAIGRSLSFSNCLESLLMIFTPPHPLDSSTIPKVDLRNETRSA